MLDLRKDSELHHWIEERTKQRSSDGPTVVLGEREATIGFLGHGLADV